MVVKIGLTLVAEALIFSALLFGAAGTLVWPAAWAYLVLFFVGALWITLLLARHDPALLAERMKLPVQKDQPIWDRVFLLAMMVAWCGWLALMGLDAVRFRWSAMPVWLQCAGADGVVVPDDRSRFSGEHVSGARRENPNGTGAQSDFDRTIRRGPPSALRRRADLSAGECAAAWLLVRPGGLDCSFKRRRISDGDGGSGTAVRS